jgi:hypothetical protein
VFLNREGRHGLAEHRCLVGLGIVARPWLGRAVLALAVRALGQLVVAVREEELLVDDPADARQDREGLGLITGSVARESAECRALIVDVDDRARHVPGVLENGLLDNVDADPVDGRLIGSAAGPYQGECDQADPSPVTTHHSHRASHRPFGPDRNTLTLMCAEVHLLVQPPGGGAAGGASMAAVVTGACSLP